MRVFQNLVSRFSAVRFSVTRFSAALVVIVALLPATAMLHAADDATKPTPDEVSYARDVLPILREHCHGCHQPAISKGEFEMTRFEGLLKGGESEDAAVVPGKPDESSLLSMITPEDGEAEMPKEKSPLAKTQIDLIRRWIAEGAKNDAPASVGPVVDAEHPPVYELPPVITSLEYSPDGKLLAVSGYHEVLLHKADGSGIEARLIGLSERIESARFSPDGKQLATTGGQPGRLGEVQIWDVAKRELTHSIPVTYDTVYGGSWSGDGKLIGFGCADNTFRAVEAATGKQVLFSGAHTDWVLDTVFSVKSTHLISVGRDRSMKLTEVKTQRFIDNITSITPGALKGGLVAVDRHPTKDELLCAGADGEPKLYKMLRTKARKIGDDFNLIRKYPKLAGRVFAVRFSRDGNQIVAGSSHNGKGDVQVFNANDAKLIAKMESPGGGVYAVAFSPDGKTVAAGGFDGYVRLYEAASGKLIKKFMPVPIKDAK